MGGLKIDGPLLFPNKEDLPFLARPLTARERARALQVAKAWGLSGLEESLPIAIVGTGPNVNAATDNGLQRAADVLGMSVPEVKNRATITGAIDWSCARRSYSYHSSPDQDFEREGPALPGPQAV